jgi:hypothetical protein
MADVDALKCPLRQDVLGRQEPAHRVYASVYTEGGVRAPTYGARAAKNKVLPALPSKKELEALRRTGRRASKYYYITTNTWRKNAKQ